MSKGQKPVSQRQGPGKAKFSFSPRNPLDLPEILKRDIESKGMEYRWLDSTEMARSLGAHKNGWEVYRRDTDQDPTLGLIGASADKTIRSGSLILGVRPKEVGEGHRAWLEDKRRAQNRFVKEAGQQFRNEGARRGLDSRSNVDVSEETFHFEEE